MKRALVSIMIIIVIIIILSPTTAADSTPSATIKEKLEILKAEIASKAAKLKLEINRKLTNKAYTGVIKSKSETSLILASKTSTKLVSVNQDTVYEDKNPLKKGAKKVTLSIATIKEESNIAALGDVDDTGVLHARKVIILPLLTSQIIPKSILWGQIISISDDLVSIKTKEGTDTISTEEIKTKFKIDDFVIITGIMGKNDILEASYLYVIPKGAVLKPKIASPSAIPLSNPKSNKNKSEPAANTD